jgi:hypothetical protein
MKAPVFRSLRVAWFLVAAIPLNLAPCALAQDAPPPSTPAPAADDVVRSATYDLGDHTVEYREVTANSLPCPPPKAATPVPQPLTEEQKARLAALRAAWKGSKNLALGGTTYFSASHPAWTQLRCYPPGGGLPVAIVSSIDWNLLRGGRFTLPDGTDLSVMLMLSSIDEDRARAAYAARSSTYTPPPMPAFPAGKASYTVVSGTLSPEQSAMLDALHAIHDRDHDKLLAAQRLREQQALEAKQAAAERAKQPRPNVVMRYRFLTPEEIRNR